jgi:hypothetical protein
MAKMRLAGIAVFACGTIIGMVLTSLSQTAQPQASGVPATIKQLGTIKSVTGNVIVLAPDAGPEIRVLVEDSTRMVRIPPGEKDLHKATPISLKDLQPGDRVLVRGNAGSANQVVASAVISMKLSDIASRQQQEREDWQKRGIAGIVKSIDAAAGTITVAMGSSAGQKTVAVRTTRDTVIRRYAPDSVRFDDAKPSSLAQIKPDDQLRARGTRNADGTELSAEELVSGSFHNVAGAVDSVDASSGTVTVLDLATKKPVLVKVTADSELRRLPAEIAQHMAMRLSGGPGAAPGPKAASGRNISGPEAGGAVGQQRRGDIQQIFNRLPVLTVADMQKGDTVMIVATEWNGDGAVTAIKLLDGVAPILAATPKKGGQTMTLSPWSLGGQGGDDASE